MTHAICRWLVRRHPGWWRRRYEDEMFSLLESAPCTLSAAVDIGRSCLRVWTECHRPDARAARSTWLTPLRLTIQLPLALAVMMITVAACAVGLVELLESGRAAPANFWMVAAPIGTSGAVAMLTVLRDGRQWTTNRVTVAVVGSAVAAGLAALTVEAADHPRLWIEWRTSSGPGTIGPGDALLVWSACFATMGLIVRSAFRALPLRRCLFNCVHRDRVPS